MKPGNKRRFFVSSAVLVSILLVNADAAQSQNPLLLHLAVSSTENSSPSTEADATTQPTIKPTASPTPTPNSVVSPTSLPSPAANPDVSPKQAPSDSTTPSIETKPTIKPTVSPTPTPDPVVSPTPSPSPAANPDVSPKQAPSDSTTPSIDWGAVGAIATILGIILTVLTFIFSPKVTHFWYEKDRRKQQDAANKEAELKQAGAEAKQKQAIEFYRKNLIYALENLQIFRMSSPLKLENIYVKLKVRQEQTLSPTEEEEKASLAGGEPTEFLRQFQRRLAEKAATAISPEEALTQHKRITVLGEPGAGKTTILRHLAVRMAKDEPSLPYLPIYVELKFLEGNTENVLEFVAADLAKRYGFQNARPYLEKQLEDGNAALLLDGLDEVLGGKSPAEAKNAYNQAVNQVNQLATRFPNAPIAVTCRRAGWRGGLTGFQTMEVLEFDEHHIKEFANNWFNSDPSKAEGLWQELDKNLRMKTLAGNPLILSLMAIVYDREWKLPERRSELYQHCVEVLLEEWDAEPNRDVERFRQFTPTQMQNLLIEVAWYFHQQGISYFREAELLRQLPSFLSNAQINISPEENKAILKEITDSSSLLKEAAYKLHGFLHLTFQEYFAARAAKKKGAIGWQEVVKHRHEPWWEEVILLLAECMDDATPLLLGILGRSLPPLPPENINQLIPEREPLAVNDDLFYSDLLLAARCLVGKPKILMQGLRDRIITEVKDLLSTSPYALDWERAAKVLVEIGDSALINQLFSMLSPPEIDPTQQINIALAFLKSDNPILVKSLLELLKTAKLHGQVFARILYVLSEMKAIQAVPQLQYMFKNETNNSNKLEIATTLLDLGEKSVVSDLMDILIDENCFEDNKILLLELLGRSEDKTVASQLLPMLVSEKTSISTIIKPAIAQAVKDLKDLSLVDCILGHLQDETIDWQIRWLLTESLEGLPESAITSLKSMQENQNIDECVRVGIAATLGTWGEQESIHLLREAIESRIVPPNWRLGNSLWIGYVWRRIIRTLKSLGDNSVVPVLENALNQSAANWKEEGLSSALFIRDDFNSVFTRTRKYSESAYEGKGIILAASECDTNVIAQQVLKILYKQKSRFLQDELLSTLPKLTTKSLVPELLFLLAERRKYKVNSKRWFAVIKAIGEVADDSETVSQLREVGLYLNEREQNDLKPAIYKALYLVSRRARVRVSHDEQIENLTN